MTAILIERFLISFLNLLPQGRPEKFPKKLRPRAVRFTAARTSPAHALTDRHTTTGRLITAASFGDWNRQLFVVWLIKVLLNAAQPLNFPCIARERTRRYSRCRPDTNLDDPDLHKPQNRLHSSNTNPRPPANPNPRLASNSRRETRTGDDPDQLAPRRSDTVARNVQNARAHKDGPRDTVHRSGRAHTTDHYLHAAVHSLAVSLHPAGSRADCLAGLPVGCYPGGFLAASGFDWLDYFPAAGAAGFRVSEAEAAHGPDLL